MTEQTNTPSVILVDDHRVACSGEGGALGHPKVFLEMGGDGEVVCGYCDRHYVLRGGPADTSAH